MVVGKPGHSLALPAVAQAVEVLAQPDTGCPACPSQCFPQHGDGDGGTRTVSTRQRGPHCPLPEERALYLLVQMYTPYIEELVLKTFIEAFPLGFRSTDYLYFLLLQCIYIYICIDRWLLQ